MDNGTLFMSGLRLLSSAETPSLDMLAQANAHAGGTLPVSLYLPLMVSLIVLVALVVVLVNCVTCCKEREINFKEFEDHFDDEIDFTPPAEDTPSMQSPAEVYTLAVSPVPLPGPPHLQPLASITEASSGFKVGRHSLSYIQEIGNGWFGQVLLSEIYTDPGGARVVVKELKANANAKEQNDFLQQGDPYRVLQHPNILQCLGQGICEAICLSTIGHSETLSCCSCRGWPAKLLLVSLTFTNTTSCTATQTQNPCAVLWGLMSQAEISALLCKDLTVKVGDYGIGPYRYKEDYIITEDDVFTPLRWLAPELVVERHGGVITMEQTKASNVWALGVTLWELFENAAQPYPHLSDREVLHHVIKEQQVKLYEVLQFCWLSPEKRATAEEVHRLLIYLRMQGQKDMEEDFEQRWDALKPNPTTRQTVSHSSFPILDQFADDALRQEIDEVLTITETSKGLSFEYVWEAAKHNHYDSTHGRSGMDTTLNYQSMFFPVSREDIQAHFPDATPRVGGAESGNPPLGIPGIVPVFDSQKSSNGNEYYIQLEEQGESADGDAGNEEPDTGFTSSQKDFVILQDVRLDESSTDADFFHQSIDSKDSYLPDSHIWSSLENDSPCHMNIFTEEGSKHEDSPSWSQNFLELPQRCGNPFLDVAVEVQEVNLNPSYFLEEEARPLPFAMEGERKSADVKRLLDTEKLADNFVFLREQNLMKEDSGFMNPQQNFLLPGNVHEPEEAFKMNSWDNLETLDGLNKTDTHLQTANSSTADFLDSPSTNLGQFLLENETLVPSITVVAHDNTDSQMPVRNGSSTEDLTALQTSDKAVDSGFSSTSERFEPITNIMSSHIPFFSDCATTDSLSTDAKISSLADDPEVSNTIGSKMPESLQIQTIASENGQNEDLTSNDPLSELIEDADLDLEANLSDQEESFLETNGHPLVRASLLVSGPSLDQISQDSLLEDSMSTTVLTIDNSSETPDSLNSLDIHRLAEQAEELNAQVSQNKLQPPYKISDSGYETENLESPEWNSQPNVADCSPVKNGISTSNEEDSEELAISTNLVAPKIVISEAEGMLEARSVNPSEDQQPDHGAPAEEPPTGSNYRDSAYFSDNEPEPEKKAEESTAGSATEITWMRSSESPTREVYKEKDIDALFSQQESSALVEPDAEDLLLDITSDIKEQLRSEVAETLVSPSGEETKPQILQGSFPETLSPLEDLESSPLPSDTSSKARLEGAVHAKLTRTYAHDGHKIKEPDVEGRYLSRRDSLEGQEDGVDADEEDENSEDSDDDMRAYQLHSSSSDSEDETIHVVPVIVSDDTSSKNLKSLLKPTNLNIEASSSPFGVRYNAENSRRAVSFFDDVTVYLFDQETPTKELGDHSSGLSSQSPELSSPVSTASYLNRFANSESSTDEEGGGFEWDDDFTSPGPAFLSKIEKDPMCKTVSSTPPSVGHMPQPSWSSSSAYSRFAISPANLANFSLTHLTDSDIEQGGK
ncbi:hypothetical protein GOODEAATRI_007535 [Goodea atripinnis]|uniref:Protein kinase domain-containing protein n=1 Tax=Goodea atripinnis TaxID=208336 RepID=A0ABV0N8R4_9TELE